MLNDGLLALPMAGSQSLRRIFESVPNQSDLYTHPSERARPDGREGNRAERTDRVDRVCRLTRERACGRGRACASRHVQMGMCMRRASGYGHQHEEYLHTLQCFVASGASGSCCSSMNARARAIRPLDVEHAALRRPDLFLSLPNLPGRPMEVHASARRCWHVAYIAAYTIAEHGHATRDSVSVTRSTWQCLNGPFHYEVIDLYPRRVRGNIRNLRKWFITSKVTLFLIRGGGSVIKSEPQGNKKGIRRG